ncbi:MAG: HDOD domain-containing protein [Acidimicrobiia bacterium]
MAFEPRKSVAAPDQSAAVAAMMLDLPAVIESAQSLEPLPASVGRLAQLVSDVDTDLREIVEVISFDQALTGNLLRRANSAASAARNPIRTVHEAVVRLGTATVLALAMSASVAKRMNRSLPEYGMAEGELWKHSVRAAIAAEAVRSAAKTPVPPEVATAALLHDIGKLVLCRFLGPQILNLLNIAQDVDDLTPTEAEAVLLEVHHGELGGLVAQHWRLPDTIVRGITYHHRPDEVLEPIAFGVQLANFVAHVTAEQPLHESDIEARDHALAELGIPGDRWDKICVTSLSRFEELSSRYS